MTGTSLGYRTPARLLHWIIAVAVLLMIPAGLIMTRDGTGKALQDALFLFHKNTGALLIPLILARILYRWRHPAPPLPVTMPDWQKRAARVSHLGLYGLLVIMPLSGFVRVRADRYPIELVDRLGAGTWLPKSKALAEAAQGLHYAAAMLLIALLALHVGAALHHALIRRDGVWQHMWPPFGR